MAINFTPKENARIRRVVKNFNARSARAGKQGMKVRGATLKVSDIKARHRDSSIDELNKELKLLDSFSLKKSKEQYTNLLGAKAPKWKFEYLKANQEAAKAHFLREHMRVSGELPEFPAERMKLASITKKINILNKPIDQMNQHELNSYMNAISEYMAVPALQRAGYRGFLSEVESVMTLLGYDQKTKNSLFRKLSKLKPYQFESLYEDNKLIERVYDMADSPTYKHGIKLNTSRDDASNRIERLLEEIDDLVEEYSQY